ncbi:hypothetical protein ACL02O_29095 [Micromonospora sp. MS34]
MLLRLAYVSVTNAFAVLRLLPMNNSVRELIELGYLVGENDLTPAHE